MPIAPGDFLAPARASLEEFGDEGRKVFTSHPSNRKIRRQCCPINYQSLASSDRSRFDPQRFDVRWHVRCARPLVDPITTRGQGDHVRSLLGIFQVQTGKGFEVIKMSIDSLLNDGLETAFHISCYRTTDVLSNRSDNLRLGGHEALSPTPGSREQARKARRRAQSGCRDNRKLPVGCARRFPRLCRLVRQLRARRSAGWFFLPSRQLMPRQVGRCCADRLLRRKFLHSLTLRPRRAPVQACSTERLSSRDRLAAEPWLYQSGQCDHVTIVALSSMLALALAAAEELANEGISAEVIDPRSISPLDVGLIVELD